MSARVWNGENGRELFVLEGHTHYMQSLYSASFSPDSRRIITGGGCMPSGIEPLISHESEIF